MAHSPQLATAADTLRPAGKKVLVVGATGFLGAKVRQNLALEKSAAVVAMSRKGAPTGGDADIEWVRGDMMDPASLDRALQGVDVVVSSANSYMKGNLDTDFQGNKNLIEGAARARMIRVASGPVKLFSALGYDLIQMFLFFRTGLYVSDISMHERFFGPPPPSRDAITRWARNQQLIP